MRILYVEDNEANQALVGRVAKVKNHSIVYRDEGEGALELLATDTEIDLILLDIELAGAISGLDVVKTLRGRNDHRPIVAVTAYAMMGDRERILSAGCDQYLPKPLVITDLLALMQHYETGEPLPASLEPEPVAATTPETPATPESPVTPETPATPQSPVTLIHDPQTVAGVVAGTVPAAPAPQTPAAPEQSTAAVPAPESPAVPEQSTVAAAPESSAATQPAPETPTVAVSAPPAAVEQPEEVKESVPAAVNDQTTRSNGNILA